MADVKFENVVKRYNKETVILENFSLEIKDKEFLVLVGPSGCGKSTLLRMIAGLEEISEGKLYIGDKQVNDIPPRDRDIAMVFQDYALYPHLTVKDNMAFALKMKKIPWSEIAPKVSDVAMILGLENLLERKPKELSGGQRQRVAIGRAIVRNPKVFLFDEPLSNLDAKLRVQMRVEIAKLHKQLNTTIVYVTHDQIEAMTLADRIVVLKDGVVQQIGTPLELYEKPANAFVGGFIGSPVMNQLSGSVAQQEGSISIRGDGFEIPICGRISKALEDNKNLDVLVGIRPQDLTITESEDNHLTAEIEVIEPIGSESYLYFTLGKKQWIAKCDGLPEISEGQIAKFKINLPNLHVFTNDGKVRVA